MTTATATDPQTFPIWERLVVAVVPIAVVIWLLNFAWFQYGLSGPRFTQQLPDLEADITTVYYFSSPWLGMLGVATVITALALSVYFGYRLLRHGTRHSAARYIGAILVACFALAVLGFNVVTAVQ